MKKSVRVLSLILVITLVMQIIPFSVITVFAEGSYNYTVKGTITDENGEGISNASISVFDITDGESVGYFRTSDNGDWQCDEVNNGNKYLISYYHPLYSFESNYQEFSIDNNPTIIETVIARRNDVEDLSESSGADFNYEIINGNFITISKYIGSSSKIKIPQKIGNYTVQSISDGVFKNNITLTDIIFPDSLETIGDDMFNGCKNLKSVTLNCGLTNIGNNSFRSCESLENITIPNTVTQIGNSAFYGCKLLSSISIPDSVSAIGSNAFSNCSVLSEVDFYVGLKAIGSLSFSDVPMLKEIKIPDTVTSIGYRAFYGNANLESVKLSKNWKETTGYSSYPTYYGEIFANCAKLKSVSVAEGASTVPSHAFDGCANLTSITIPDSVESIKEYAFYDCDGLTSIALPKKLQSIGNFAFSKNDGITSVILPNTVTTIGYRAFAECSELTEINYPTGWNACSGYSSYPTNYGEIFDDCAKLTSIEIPEGVTSIPANAFYGCKNLTSVQIASTVKSIGNNAFYDCDGLTSVSLPSGLESIGYFAFASNDKIVEFSIPDSVTTIGYRAFADCNALTTANYPVGWKNHIGYSSYPTNYGSIFADCEKLTKITVPEGVEEIPTHAFEDSTNLREVEFPSSLKKIGDNAFDNCSGLTKLELPNGLQTIGTYAFYNCDGLVELNLPDSITTFGYRVFASCDNLKSATYPKGWTECIGYSSYPTVYGSIFAECSKLESITIPEGTTVIPQYAFADSNLKRVILPASLISIKNNAFDNCQDLKYVSGSLENISDIGNYAFSNCIRLKTLTFSEKLSWIGNYAFNRCNALTVYCPDKSTSAIYMIDNDLSMELYDASSASTSSSLLNTNESHYVANTVAARANGYVPLNFAYDFTDHELSGVSNLKLKIRIPSNSELIEKTLMLDGVRLTGYDYSDHVLTIALSKATGKLSFNITPTTDSKVSSYALLTYSKNGKNVQEIIGVINESIPLISIQADNEINASTVKVKGVGPSDSDISLYVDGKLSRTLHSNKSGSYEGTVSISDPKNYSTYTITAKTDYNGESVVATKDVQYCTEAPVVQSFVMNYNGNSYNMIGQGTSKPTVTFVPGEDFNFEVRMSNSSKIGKVYVCSTRSNVTKRIEAVYNKNTGTYVAKGLFDPNNTGYVPGTITVEYSPAKQTIDFSKVNTDYSSDKYVNSASEPIKEALAAGTDECLVITKNTENEISGKINFSSVNRCLDFSITTSSIPTYLTPENASNYGYEAIEDDVGKRIYAYYDKIVKGGIEEDCADIIDFSRDKFTKYIIKKYSVDTAVTIDSFWDFASALQYGEVINDLYEWNQKSIKISELKQAVLSSDMSETECSSKN